MTNLHPAVAAELQRALAKYPSWPTDPLHALAVLGEEFGELTKAVLQETYEPHKQPRTAVREEAIQTAAMALRFLESLEVYQFSRAQQHEQPVRCPAMSQPPEVPGDRAPSAEAIDLRTCQPDDVLVLGDGKTETRVRFGDGRIGGGVWDAREHPAPSNWRWDATNVISFHRGGCNYHANGTAYNTQWRVLRIERAAQPGIEGPAGRATTPAPAPACVWVVTYREHLNADLVAHVASSAAHAVQWITAQKPEDWDNRGWFAVSQETVDAPDGQLLPSSFKFYSFGGTPLQGPPPDATELIMLKASQVHRAAHAAAQAAVRDFTRRIWS